MAKGFRAAQVTSQYITDVVRRRALAAISEHDQVLSKVYDKIAAGIRKDLRAAGFTVKQVREILEKHFAGTKEERVAILEKAIRSAAQEGRKLDKQTFDAVFGPEEVAKSPRPFAPSSAPPKTLSRSRRRVSEGE